MLLAWIFIKVLLYVVKKALNKTKIDEWSKKLSKTEIFGNTTINIVLTNVILSVLKWLLVLIFILIGADIFGLNMVSEGIRKFYCLFTKVVNFAINFCWRCLCRNTFKKAIHTMFKSLELTGGNLVANIAFYLIVVFISIAALDQAGIDTQYFKKQPNINYWFNLTVIYHCIWFRF